jgi:hypothetical protein
LRGRIKRDEERCEFHSKWTAKDEICLEKCDVEGKNSLEKCDAEGKNSLEKCAGRGENLR